MSHPVVAVDGQVLFVEEDTSVAVSGGVSAEDFGVVHLFTRGWLWFGFLRDVQGIWWFDGKRHATRFVTDDTENFRVLDDDYGVDREQVFLQARGIPGADPGSFEMVGNSGYFARDRHRIYVKGGQHFFWFDDIEADAVIANGPYVTDRDHLFHHYSALTYANDGKATATVAYSLDDEHDMLLADWLRKHHAGTVGWWHPEYGNTPDGAARVAHDWFRTDTAVFFRTAAEYGGMRRETWNLVRGADPATFVVLDADHARDGVRVFCRWRTVRNAEPATFRALGGMFGADRSTVYFNGHPVQDADPASFTAVPAVVEFGFDRERLYRRDFARTSEPFGYPDDVLVAVPGGDPSTFQVFGERGVWAADSRTVYLRGVPKKKLDAASFRFLGETDTNCWACDRHGLYRSNGSMTVAGVDGARFVKLDDHWGSDGDVVFSFVTGAVQKSADAATFRVIDEHGGAEDQHARYRIDRGRVRKIKRSS